MTLAALIARGIQGVATATAATPATLTPDLVPSVANVAGVAVANTPERVASVGSAGSSVANVASVAVANAPEKRMTTDNQYDPIRWPRFVALCTAHDVTESEVRAIFTEQDIADLCEEPDGQLPKHAASIVGAAKRARCTGIDEVNISVNLKGTGHRVRGL